MESGKRNAELPRCLKSVHSIEVKLVIAGKIWWICYKMCLEYFRWFRRKQWHSICWQRDLKVLCYQKFPRGIRTSINFHPAQGKKAVNVLNTWDRLWSQSWKNDARWRISDEVWSAWKCDEKLSWVFDLSSQSKLKLRRKQRNKIANKIRYPNIGTVKISFLLTWWV